MSKSKPNSSILQQDKLELNNIDSISNEVWKISFSTSREFLFSKKKESILLLSKD